MSEAKDYQKQRRNTYGEAPHAARKAIPRGKQRQNQKERRQVQAELTLGEVERAQEVAVRSRVRDPFRKAPDRPLGEVLLGRIVRAFLRGRISAATFRRKLKPLREGYPGFLPAYRALCHGLSHVPLAPEVVAVLAELK
jgi:hypothetical protein